MHSTFTGLEIGKRSIFAHQQGLATIGHNVSNAAREGYSRQRVNFDSTPPLYSPGMNRAETPGQIGQGVDIASIERVRDEILEGRIVARSNEQSYWQTRERYLLMVEQVYNEPTDLSLRTLTDRFWDGWQELSVNPGEMAARQSVLQRGKEMIDGIHARYRSLSEIRTMLEDEIQVAVGRVNDIMSEVSSLNEQIVKVKAMDDNPNDLLDRRDLLVEELSSLVNITVDRRDPDEFEIHTSGFILVQGKQNHPLQLELDPQNDGFSRIAWADSGETVQLRGGKLSSLLDLRDGDVRGEIQNLDNLTVNFIDLVNEIHREGYGINGRTGVDFFTEYPAIGNTLGNYDRNGDGEFDSSYIFRITGTNRLEPQEQIGLAGRLTLSDSRGNLEIEYYPTDTVDDLIGRINNSGSEVVARLDREGRLSLKASPAADLEQPDFVIRHVEDSGQFLVGYAGVLLRSGPDGAYDWAQPDAVLALRGGGLEFAVAPLAHPSGWIEVNPAIEREPAAIAAGFAAGDRAPGPGTGEAALAIASLRNTPVMVGRTQTFDDWFADTVADLGLRGEIAQRTSETQDLIMQELRTTRESISGVNIDEELIQMIRYQQGYAAAARFITTFNTLLDTIINRMGV